MSRTSRPRLSLSLFVLAALALLAAGVVGALVLLPGPVAGTAQESAGGGSVRVTAESYDGARQVSARWTTTESPALTTSEAGRVTASSCSPGGTVTSGDVLLSVDDRPLVALATDVPLWRDLRPGVRGDDVVALQTELARLGYGLVPDGDYGPATRAAVRDVMADAGAARPDGTLTAGAVVWLPTNEVTVSECLIGVGDRTDGGEVATLAGGLTALTVVDPPGASGWVVRHDDLSAEIGADGTVDGAELLAAVESSDAFRLAQDEGADRLTMEIALAEPIDVGVVPPSAVVAAAEGLGCVQMDTGEVTEVEVVASALGQTMVHPVDGDLPASVRVRPDAGASC